MVDAVKAIEAYYRPIPLAGLSVVIGSTSTQSVQIPGDAADFTATVDCFLEFGDNPTAQIPQSCFIKAGFPYRYNLKSSVINGIKVAVIRHTADGTLFITPLARNF